jgi:hypothetical protein
MSNLTKAFKELRKEGYFARQNWKCCNSCGWEAIPDEQAKHAVFYYAQNANDLKEHGFCHLSWDGDGKKIVKILKANGLKVTWNGSKAQKIKVEVTE